MSKDIFKGTLLISDMDGTLLNSQHQVSTENREAIEYFVNNGGWFAVATGRADFGIWRYLPLLGVNAPCILLNGAMIYDTVERKSLWKSYLIPDVEDVVQEILLKFPGIGIEVFCDEGHFLLQESEETEKHRQRENFEWRLVSMDEIPRPWFKVILAWYPERLQEVNEFLKGKTGQFRAVFSESYFLELLNKNASKGHALTELISMLGCSTSDVVAMGDNMNDFELVEFAGTGVAVANAHPELKKVANFCCCHHDEHAVAEVIRWIEKNRIAQVEDGS